MNENVPKCDIFLPFCSENSESSDPIRTEWETALYFGKKIIPIFNSLEYVPDLLKRLRGIQFRADDLGGTISELYQEILKVLKPATPIAKQSAPILAADMLNLLDVELKREYEKVEVVEEKVEVKRGYDYVGGLVRFKVVVANNSGLNINNIDVELRMPNNVRIIRVAPKTYRKGDKASIPNMQPKQSKNIDFYMEPSICGMFPVEAAVIYQDTLGKSHSIIHEAKYVKINCPPIINLGEENVARVKNLIQSVLNAKQFKSFQLQQEPRRVFEILQEATQYWVGNSVTRPLIWTSPIFRGEAYYFVLSKVPDAKNHQEQIVVRLEVDAERNMAFITIACEKPETTCGVLTNVWYLCEKRMAEAFGVHLHALWCPECCAPLSKIPKVGKKIVCSACGTTFNLERSLGTPQTRI